MEELRNIQISLKAPKKQYNKFGKFNYRSCEDILEAVKPLLDENKCILLLTDELKDIAGKIYITAKATIINSEGKEISVTSHAREEDKKGMDAAQATGSTSSYARKYALNGLFCIDDTNDLDGNKVEEKKPEEIISEKRIKLNEITSKDNRLMNNILSRYSMPSMEDLTDNMIEETYNAMYQKGLIK